VGIVLTAHSVSTLASDIVSEKVAQTAKTETSIKGNPIAGKEKLDAERCLECHDENGHDLSQGAINKFATLSGQHEGYIIKQVHDFRDEKRKYDFMMMMAKSLSEQDLADIAAFFGQQPKMHGNASDISSGENSQASNLFNFGDITRNIIACNTCHGKDGQGQINGNSIYPVIAGQQWNYLEQQLRDWRSGERTNSVGNAMGNTAKLLTDEEIKVLSHYISGL
jgi:cytochrome c553